MNEFDTNVVKPFQFPFFTFLTALRDTFIFPLQQRMYQYLATSPFHCCRRTLWSRRETLNFTGFFQFSPPTLLFSPQLIYPHCEFMGQHLEWNWRGSAPGCLIKTFDLSPGDLHWTPFFSSFIIPMRLFPPSQLNILIFNTTTPDIFEQIIHINVFTRKTVNDDTIFTTILHHHFSSIWCYPSLLPFLSTTYLFN